MSQPQPLKLNAFSSISQTLRLPLPIPRPSVPTKHSEMLISNWPPSTPDFMINPAPFPVIPCQQQQTVPAGPTGKPVPNRRGRKRLATMPSNKKHKQNLTNQRAFRERRENYLRSLESKVEMYEKAYAEYQSENRLLKEEVANLKRRLARFENYGLDGGLGITSSDFDKVSDNKNANPCCSMVNSIYSVSNMIEDNQIYHGIDEHKDNNSTHRDVIIDSNERIYLQDYSFAQSSFMQDYDEQSSSKNRSRSSTHSSASIYCDDSEISGQSRISSGNSSITTMSRQCANQEFSTTTRQTLPTPDEPQWHEQYFTHTTLTPVSSSLSSFSLMDNERGTRLYH
ncbi:19883_t:CDS:1 [Dentiscutata erythropus]|uniref:19883_t:CDS:1 n=1 Tax=Dentiscutata erythropus TaxID=1348616 RepID=A0A9N9B684_9GLOM|nr:19883_t:CDS:1 [Dentiscutata erythropus]